MVYSSTWAYDLAHTMTRHLWDNMTREDVLIDATLHMTHFARSKHGLLCLSFCHKICSKQVDFQDQAKTNGSINKHKGCLGSRGFTQQYDIDCMDTFILVVKLTTICLALSFEVSWRWCLCQVGVSNVFLQCICGATSIFWRYCLED
jgi:hypothetical protein